MNTPFSITPVQRRILDAAESLRDGEGDQNILYQHAVLCQTALPYRMPKGSDGTPLLEWERNNGSASILLRAGKIFDRGKWVQQPLPYGAKPRLTMCYISTEAVRNNSLDVDIEDSMTAFVRRLGFNTTGREIREFKQQTRSLAVADMSLGWMINEERAVQSQGKIISEIDLWFPKDEHQRVLWPSSVKLSYEFFQSLKEHAVPLPEQALTALKHNTMALDCYWWLAHRLHRIEGKPDFVSWPQLAAQCGHTYGRLRDFRKAYAEKTLRSVKTVYPAARVEATEKGLWLHGSPPPITPKVRLHPRISVVEKDVKDTRPEGVIISAAVWQEAQGYYSGWDMAELYRKWIGHFPERAKFPDKAFPKWLKSYTKGKKAP